MTITCDTPIKAILDLDEVKKLTNAYATTAKEAKKNFTQAIKQAQQSGLGEESFTVDGAAVLKDKSNELVTQAETLEDTINSWKDNVIAKAEEKRTEEIEELKTKVKAKIDEINGEMFWLNIQIAIFNSEDLKNKRESLNQSLQAYQEKYDTLCKMK